MKGKPEKNAGNKRFKLLVGFAATVVAAVILLGAGIGIYTAVVNANAAVRYDGVLMDAGEVNYFASRYKSLYIQTLKLSGVNAADTKYFWEKTDPESGKSYGELLEVGTRSYIADVVAASRIYLNYASFGSGERERVERACLEIVEYKGGGSIESFNSEVSEYGFDYDDFRSASEKLYMASMAKIMIYGQDGSGLSSFESECDKYFEGYTRVKLLFFRTETKLAEDGSIASLTDGERAERAANIEKIRGYIANHKAGLEDAISPETFDVYFERSDGDPDYYDRGYYLHPNAEQTASFAEAFPEIYGEIEKLEIGDYAEATWDVDLDPDTDELGVCFIYRCPPSKGAYKDPDNIMFSDFYSDAAQYLYSELVSELAGSVEFTENYGALDVVAMPSNSRFYVNSFD